MGAVCCVFSLWTVRQWPDHLLCQSRHHNTSHRTDTTLSSSTSSSDIISGGKVVLTPSWSVLRQSHLTTCWSRARLAGIGALLTSLHRQHPTPTGTGAAGLQPVLGCPGGDRKPYSHLLELPGQHLSQCEAANKVYSPVITGYQTQHDKHHGPLPSSHTFMHFTGKKRVSMISFIKLSVFINHSSGFIMFLIRLN